MDNRKVAVHSKNSCDLRPITRHKEQIQANNYDLFGRDEVTQKVVRLVIFCIKIFATLCPQNAWQSKIKDFAISSMYIANKNGDSTEPCLTPKSSANNCDRALYHLTAE